MAIPSILEQLKGKTAPVVEPPAKPPAAAPSATRQNLSRLGIKLPKRTQMFTGLDVGTTKICALIGEIDPEGKVTVLGIASTPSQGLRRGVVVDLDETVDSIRVAVRKAEEIAQVAVRDVFVGIAGGHIECHQTSARIDVANPERGVTRADIRRVIDRSIGDIAAMEREIIHTIPQRYIIDDGAIVNPEGFSSRKLEAEVLVVTAAVTSAQNIVRAVAQAGLRASAIYLEPLASSLAVLNEEERELGCVLIDIGGGTSDIAIWMDGAVRFTGVVPFGGDAITEDVSKGLRISRYDAENLKKRYGSCLSSTIDPGEMLDVPVVPTETQEQVSRQFLCEIIESRVEEILVMVKRKIESMPGHERAYSGLVLTGGASLQAGLPELAARVFGRPCRVGRPGGLSGLASVASSPIYSTGVGLVLYGLLHEREQALAESNLFQRLVRYFRKAVDWY